VQFFVVYIKEAHALDSSWPMTGGEHPLVQEPITLEERKAIANQCVAALELEHLPTLIDEIDDGVATRYAAWPDRLFLIGVDGKVAYSGGRGPFGFKPAELEGAILEIKNRRE
jgi:hypothetical protein